MPRTHSISVLEASYSSSVIPPSRLWRIVATVNARCRCCMAQRITRVQPVRVQRNQTMPYHGRVCRKSTMGRLQNLPQAPEPYAQRVPGLAYTTRASCRFQGPGPLGDAVFLQRPALRPDARGREAFLILEIRRLPEVHGFPGCLVEMECNPPSEGDEMNCVMLRVLQLTRACLLVCLDWSYYSFSLGASQTSRESCR